MFDVGTIRSICDSTIEDISYTHGLFLCSYMKQSDILNERIVLRCANKDLKFKFIIIPGAMSRKIHINLQRYIPIGKRFGFIVDGKIILILPSDIRLRVSVGDKIKACNLIGFFNKKVVWKKMKNHK